MHNPTYAFEFATCPYVAEERFRDRYRIASARLPEYDYRSPGWYFVTICAHRHRRFFGSVRDGVMRLSCAGEIAAGEWMRTAEVRPNVVLDEWVVMPNHVHGLIGIVGLSPSVETPRRGVSTAPSTLHAGSLGAIVGQYKSVCTKRIRRTCNPRFAWQTRFYDHIVRNDADMARIREYIRTNPARWRG